MYNKQFKTLDLALELYRESRALAWKHYQKDQYLRAIQSVVLNLSEGSAKPTAKDRKRFYFIALGSLREVQALLEMGDFLTQVKKADVVAAHLYKLCMS